MRKGQTIFYWHSASEVLSVKFIRWTRMRMHTGSPDSHKIGVGALVSSPWLYSRGLLPKIPSGCRRGQYKLRPYTAIYANIQDAYAHQNQIQRPEPGKVKKS